VAGGRRFRHLITGGGHTCAVNPFDRVFCWGFNGSGQIGDGTTSNRLTPVRVSGFQFTRVSAGTEHTCAVTADDRAWAYCWGENEDGQLGDKTKTGRLRPVPVFGGLTFRQVSAHLSLHHTCALTPDARAYCWGRSSANLGDGSGFIRRLKPVPVLGDLHFGTVSMGYGYTCGVTVDGLAYCWGSNSEGTLGTGNPNHSVAFTPVAVAGGLQFAQLSAGAGHACGVTTSNLAYCWGGNFVGGLGDGNFGIGVFSLTPVPVAGPI
jgi:alpha-tubulin suppressor-like RCC1 family protein